MITETDFAEIVDAVARLNGISLDAAARIVSEVGDTPELNPDGEVVVFGRVCAWPIDEE